MWIWIPRKCVVFDSLQNARAFRMCTEHQNILSEFLCLVLVVHLELSIGKQFSSTAKTTGANAPPDACPSTLLLTPLVTIHFSSNYVFIVQSLKSLEF